LCWGLAKKGKIKSFQRQRGVFREKPIAQWVGGESKKKTEAWGETKGGEVKTKPKR